MNVMVLLDVTELEILDDYKLRLTFENGEVKVFDCQPLLSEKPFVAIADSAVFRRAQVEYGTVVWPGEIDISPEYLYEKSVVSRNITKALDGVLPGGRLDESAHRKHLEEKHL